MSIAVDNMVFWMITPPNNMRSFLEAVAKVWPNKVLIVACHNVTDERIKSGFSIDCNGINAMYILDEQDSKDLFIAKFINEHSDAVHVFCGISREPAQYMYVLKSINKDAKIIAITEKPALDYGPGYKRLVKKLTAPFLYRHLVRKTERVVDAIFVLSNHGIEAIKKYGWKGDNIFDFMYCDSAIEMPRRCKPIQKDDSVRFLYVGRFDFRMRGVDVIMSAFNKLDGNWKLDLVGGYGNNKDAVIKWANETPNVRYLGRWNTVDIPEKMRNYDVYICASRVDSWNGQTNIALSAGLGVVTTNEAGSDELVNQSGAGIVVQAGSIEQLHGALDFIVQDKSVTEKWSELASSYSKLISPIFVAEYFCNVILHRIYHTNVNEECPWIIKEM